MSDTGRCGVRQRCRRDADTITRMDYGLGYANASDIKVAIIFMLPQDQPVSSRLNHSNFIKGRRGPIRADAISPLRDHNAYKLRFGLDGAAPDVHFRTVLLRTRCPHASMLPGHHRSVT